MKPNEMTEEQLWAEYGRAQAMVEQGTQTKRIILQEIASRPKQTTDE